jgi:hypothetical protein
MPETEERKPSARFAAVKDLSSQPGRLFRLRYVAVFSPGSCMPRDVGAFGRDASNCYEAGRFLACILAASAAVEIILNKDSRMRRVIRGWQNMNAKLLRTAGKANLPVRELLADG